MTYKNLVKSLMIAMAILSVMSCSAAAFNDPKVNNCNQSTVFGPDFGQPYIGKIYNEDYNFSVSVPKDLTGWSGVSESAPFHGFTIFLGNERRSCIVFEVHVRVDYEDAPQYPPFLLSLGDAKGWKSELHGNVDDVDIINMQTIFSYVGDEFTADGSVKFIAPHGDRKKYEHFYYEITKSLKFGKSAER